MPAAQDRLPDPPPTLGGVRLGERARSSGALAVYEGRNQFDLPVRVSVVSADALTDSYGAEEFKAAVRRAAGVQHAALVPYTTGGQEAGLIFAVAKHVEARTVDELLGRGGALAPERALSIAATVAEVLAALEDAGTRHGDLTPRRILLPGRGQVTVTPPRILPAELAPRRVRYQSPEEARGGPGDVRSDLFVLGLLLVEMMTARSPVPGSGQAAAAALAGGRLPRPEKLVPRADPHLAHVLGRLLAVDPEDRFARAADAARALGALAQGRAVDPSPPRVEERPETAPIDLGGMRSTPSATPEPQPAPESDAPQGAIPVLGAADAAPDIKRSPGRLYLESRLGESVLEIDEDLYLGKPQGAIDIKARAVPFGDAVLRVERARHADVLHALVDDVRVGGRAVSVHELAHGERIESPVISGRYERSARSALRATGGGAVSGGPPRKSRAARVVLAVTLMATLLVAAWAAARIAAISGAGSGVEDALGTARRDLAVAKRVEGRAVAAQAAGRTGTSEGGARAAYESARSLIRRHPDEPETARLALLEVARKYPETAYAELARLVAQELEGRGRSVRRGRLETLIAEAEADAAEGRLDEGLLRLRSFAEEQLDTVEAEVARGEMVRIEAEVTARFESDLQIVRNAAAAREWRAALRVCDRMLEYAPLQRRDTIQDVKAEIQEAMESVLKGGGDSTTDGGGESPRPPPPGPLDPPRKPPAPVDTGPTDAERDARAVQAFRGARRLMDGGKSSEAIRAFVAFLREHKETPTGAKYDLEVRRRITSLAAGPAGIENAFRGRVEKRERGRWRITYDFEDEAQLLDFRDIDAFQAPPRADWNLTSGAARAKGSGALALDAHFEPDFLSMEVKINPERAHDLGLIFFEWDEPRRFYLYTVQNSFFRLGKGNGREQFRENAIVLFGPDMWADSPPGEVGFVRKCGADEPRFRPGQEIAIKAGKHDGEVWLRFAGGRTIRGSAYGDKKYEFTGLMPGAFLVNSAGYFDEIVVEGVPDPDWVAQHWRDVLSGL